MKGMEVIEEKLELRTFEMLAYAYLPILQKHS